MAETPFAKAQPVQVSIEQKDSGKPQSVKANNLQLGVQLRP